jgi:hypothetical protein
MRIPLTLALLAAGITACAPQDDALSLIVSPGPARSGAVGQPFVLDVDVSGGGFKQSFGLCARPRRAPWSPTRRS